MEKTNLLPIKTGLDSDKQRQVKTTPSLHISPLPSLTWALPRLSFTSAASDCSSAPPPAPHHHPAAQGEREWKVQPHHCLTVPLCCSFLLKLCPCSSKVLPMGCSHQFQCGLELFQETPGSSVPHTGRQILTSIPTPLWSPPGAEV